MDSNNVIVPGFDDDKNDVLKFKLQKIEGLSNGCIIFLSGYVDTYNSSFFSSQVNKIIDAGYVNLILECTRLTGIASTGFGALTNILKTIHLKCGDLFLVNVQQNIYETVELLGFTQFFKIMPSLEDAYNFLTQNSGSIQTSSVFPKIVMCPFCKKSLKAQKSGRFRCINCKSIIAISETGQVTLEQ